MHTLCVADQLAGRALWEYRPVLHCSTLWVVYEKVDWSHGREHVEAKGLTTEQADEALDDPERVVIDPDPKSRMGESVRIIGYSYTAQAVLTVVVVNHDGELYGGTAWKTDNKQELRLYRGEN